jgi:hypothetical protein
MYSCGYEFCFVCSVSVLETIYPKERINLDNRSTGRKRVIKPDGAVMRPLQAFLCFLFCTGIFIIFGLGMNQLAAEGHVRTEFDRPSALLPESPPPHVIVAGTIIDRHANEMIALADRLADAAGALHAPGGTRQQIQDAQAEYYNDLRMLHLLAARSPQTTVPEAARIQMRDTPRSRPVASHNGTGSPRS